MRLCYCCRRPLAAFTYTILVLIKLTKFAAALRLRCLDRNPVNWIFDIISSLFAKFTNVVHSLEPGETPSNSASHQAPNYVQLLKYRKILLNVALQLRCGCVYFFNLLKTSTVSKYNYLTVFSFKYCIPDSDFHERKSLKIDSRQSTVQSR